MDRRFELLVFDWDGTLIDSAGAIVASLQSACRDLGLPVPSEERARHIIGLGLYDSLAYVLPGVAPEVYSHVAERYGYHFRLRDPHTPLFPGGEHALRSRRGGGGPASNPDPGMLMDLMEMPGPAPGQPLMTGDATNDLQMAINAGVAG